VVDTRRRADVASAHMRQWRDCNGATERQAAVVEAMRVAKGNKSNAAKLLGLSRQHFYRVLGSPQGAGSRGDTDTRRDAGDRSVKRDGPTGGKRVTSVTRSTAESLTCAKVRPTLVAVSTASAVEEEEVAVTLMLPRRCVEWLDVEAVRRKHASGQSKAAKAPIVAEMIERAMATGEKAKAKA